MAGKDKAAAKQGPAELDPVALKLQHSIVYEANTSETKDDLPALVNILKTGSGALTRQEAAFLLWYHALCGPDTQTELIAANAVTACLTVLDASGSLVEPPEKTCAAGILVSLLEDESNREAVVRGRAGSTTITAVLHVLLHDVRGTMRLYAARCLRLIAEDANARSALLRSMEQSLGSYLGLYKELLADCKESHTVTQLCHYLTHMAGREDLRGEAAAGGLVEATLACLRRQKVDSAVCAALGLLCLLSENRESWPLIHKDGGIPLLVDLLGPPPRSIQDWEMERYRPLIDPAWAAEQERLRAEALRALAAAQAVNAEAAAALAAAQAAAAACAAASEKEATTPHGDPRIRNLSSKSTLKSSKSMSKHMDTAAAALQEGDSPRGEVPKQAGQQGLSSPGPGGTSTASPAVGSTAAAAASAAASVPVSPGPAPVPLPVVPPPLPAMPPGVRREDLLSVNNAALKWNAIVHLQTFSNAAGVLYQMAQAPEYMHVMSARLAASRLVPVLAMAMDDGTAGKKGGGKKKKGLSLTPEQTGHLVRITGCLKFMSLLNVNRYRIAKLGALKAMIQIYEDCGHTLLRRNAQVILSNLALLAENGQLLLDASLPEEFLVPRPMRLTPEEAEQLMKEFPGGPLAASAAAPPAAPPAPTPSLGRVPGLALGGAQAK